MTALSVKLRRDLWHLRGPFAAVALVVASGVALFVSMRSMHGYLSEAQRRTYEAGRFADVFARLERAPESIAGEIAAIPGVSAVATRVVADVLLDVPGLPEPATGRLVSIPVPRAPSLNQVHLRSGRYPRAGRRDEVLASDAFARANGLALGDRLGAVIHGRWQSLRIVGTASSPEYVYEIGAGQIFPDNRRFGVLWIDRRPLAAAFDLEGSCNDVTATLGPGAVLPEVIARLDRLLAPYGGLGAYGREDQLSHRFFSDEIAETRVTSLMLPAIFLAVTAFLLHLVMGRLIGTQRDQIAVLKAFGYSSGAVARHYLGMALLPTLAGSVAGTLGGLWFAGRLAEIYSRFFQLPAVPFVPESGVIAAGVAAAGGAALFGALDAVRRAVALPPAEAMRPEAPARFRPGLAERLGLARRLSPAAKSVLRHLERRPGKALLSALGLAFAVAIVLVGFYMFDAVEVMRDLQFQLVQREDATVAFRTATGGATRELLRLPGVLAVEPYRVLAVRLRHGAREQQTALLGLPAGGKLRRIVDRHRREFRPPPEGLLITTELALRLDAAPGDRVTVEVLEGRRPVREMLVAGRVDELIGTAAYVDLGTARQLMGEGELASGAYLTVDPRAERALFARLKRLPRVVGVGARRAALESFDRTLAESFRISIGSLLGFACVIAFGMVYNGARISLSERGRELASLRVLGFSRREVAAILLGEQAALTLLAIPLGFALGLSLCGLIVWRFRTELFRLPFVLSGPTLVGSAAVVVAAALLSALAVRRRLDRLDLIAVLKTRE